LKFGRERNFVLCAHCGIADSEYVIVQTMVSTRCELESCCVVEVQNTNVKT